MTQFRRLLLFGFIVLLFIGVVACGSSNNSSTSDQAWGLNSSSEGGTSAPSNMMEQNEAGNRTNTIHDEAETMSSKCLHKGLCLF